MARSPASQHALKWHKLSVHFLLGMIDKVRVLCLGGSIATHQGAAQPQTSSLIRIHVSNLEEVGSLIRPCPDRVPTFRVWDLHVCPSSACRRPSRLRCRSWTRRFSRCGSIPTPPQLRLPGSWSLAACGRIALLGRLPGTRSSVTSAFLSPFLLPAPPSN